MCSDPNCSLKRSLSAPLLFLLMALVLASAFAGQGDQRNALSPSNRVLLMEATIECGWGYAYSASSGTYSSQQMDWLRSILAYVNNGEVNRKDFTFEEYTGDGLSLGGMKKIMARPDFRKWAGKELIKAMESLMIRRGKLIDQ